MRIIPIDYFVINFLTSTSIGLSLELCLRWIQFIVRCECSIQSKPFIALCLNDAQCGVRSLGNMVCLFKPLGTVLLVLTAVYNSVTNYNNPGSLACKSTTKCLSRFQTNVLPMTRKTHRGQFPSPPWRHPLLHSSPRPFWDIGNIFLAASS